MNSITKKSFYSFLALYLFSSFIFLSLASYWFYTAQVATEMNANYYKMSHISDSVSSDVISSHMRNKEFTLKVFPDARVALYDEMKSLKYGSTIDKVDFTKEYYLNKEVFTLVSQKTNNHLGMKYVVVQSTECTTNIANLKESVFIIAIVVAIVIIIIAVLLSYMFLKPIKEKMQEIENFVKDTTHELNTPITALMMSTSRAKSKKEYDEKIIQNISISTKQLYDIYSSLSYISFENKSEESIVVEFDKIVQETIVYFEELLDKKRIQVQTDLSPCTLNIAPTKAKMLINNLLSNSIKYSTPKSKIYIKTTGNSLYIKDEGIGIAEDKLASIFERFTRANSYAGGFGVGLNIVDGIVKEYGYKIHLDSTEGKGTTIVIEFT